MNLAFASIPKRFPGGSLLVINGLFAVESFFADILPVLDLLFPA